MITKPENFWRHVQKGDHCWLWTGAVNAARGGYGEATYGRKHYRAHRLAWILTCGEIPEGLAVLHHCDTPACVRPEFGSASSNGGTRDSDNMSGMLSGHAPAVRTDNLSL